MTGKIFTVKAPSVSIVTEGAIVFFCRKIQYGSEDYVL